jgi:predicted nucleic acid-binding protein
LAVPFLDTNILIRHLTQDHPERSPRASAYLQRIENGELQVRLFDTVIFETVFTLQHSYRQPRLAIRENLLPLIELTGIVLPGKRRWRRVFDRYVDLNISFADAYHSVLMEQLKIDQAVSFDREFDRVPGIARIEP